MTGMGRQAMRYICKYGTTHQPGSLAPLPYSSVEMWISNVQVPALKAYNQAMKISHPDSTEVLRTSASVWIPYEIVRFTYPELVTQYQNEHPAASTSGQACDSEANQSASTSGCGSQVCDFSLSSFRDFAYSGIQRRTIKLGTSLTSQSVPIRFISQCQRPLKRQL
jgi:hypothetical protein